MKLSDKAILTIQTAGFVGALATLPFMHGLTQALFSTGFAVHFIGDLFRLDKDGVINIKGFLNKILSKAKEYVKILPWLQYVGLQLSLFPGLNELAIGAAALVSVAAYIARTKHGLGPNDPKLRRILDATGYPLLVGGIVSHVPVAQFIGGALVMTEFVYELIYP